MKTSGKPCPPLGEALEDSASTLKDHAEVINLIDWHDQAAELKRMAERIEQIGKMVRSGETEVAQIPGYAHRNY